MGDSAAKKADRQGHPATRGDMVIGNGVRIGDGAVPALPPGARTAPTATAKKPRALSAAGMDFPRQTGDGAGMTPTTSHRA
jgi:hypothetical protein